MITKDWAQEAANEIAENVRCGDGNEEDYREIIVKHLPLQALAAAPVVGPARRLLHAGAAL